MDSVPSEIVALIIDATEPDLLSAYRMSLVCRGFCELFKTSSAGRVMGLIHTAKNARSRTRAKKWWRRHCSREPYTRQIKFQTRFNVHLPAFEWTWSIIDDVNRESEDFASFYLRIHAGHDLLDVAKQAVYDFFLRSDAPSVVARVAWFGNRDNDCRSLRTPNNRMIRMPRDFLFCDIDARVESDRIASTEDITIAITIQSRYRPPSSHQTFFQLATVTIHQPRILSSRVVEFL